jgi:hypothetical protein
MVPGAGRPHRNWQRADSGAIKERGRVQKVAMNHEARNKFSLDNLPSEPALKGLEAETAAESDALLPALGLFAEFGWKTRHALAELHRTHNLLLLSLLSGQAALASVAQARHNEASER